MLLIQGGMHPTERYPTGPWFLNVPRTFRARKASCQLQSANCFEKLIFPRAFNVKNPRGLRSLMTKILAVAKIEGELWIMDLRESFEKR